MINHNDNSKQYAHEILVHVNWDDNIGQYFISTNYNNTGTTAFYSTDHILRGIENVVESALRLLNYDELRHQLHITYNMEFSYTGEKGSSSESCEEDSQKKSKAATNAFDQSDSQKKSKAATNAFGQFKRRRGYVDKPYQRDLKPDVE